MGIYDISGRLLTDTSICYDSEPQAPYWIFHLDCARKWFTIANVKSLIDSCYSSGLNQIELHFSENEGFRLALADMTVSANGTTYDLTPCLGGVESPNNWYTQSNMDEIIAYAQSKGIDVVPSFDMPGHMGRILSIFTQFKMNNTNTLDIKNSAAVNFAKAVVDKYAKYFVSRGCHFYNIGYDEIMGYGVGFPQLYSNGDFQYVVDFANGLFEVVESNGLKPRAFNEVFYYAQDYKYYTSKDAQVLYWTNAIPNSDEASPAALQTFGYQLINSNHDWYWVLGNPTISVTAETLRNADVLKGFAENTLPHNGYGAMFCVWCDSTSTQSGDGGAGVVASVTPLIQAFGVAIQNALNS